MRRMCAGCGEREARYFVRLKRPVHRRVVSRSNPAHDLCKRCWVATLNRVKASRL